MTDEKNTPVLTAALEDYLETIYRLVSVKGFARVKDISEARQVRPASVTPALRRLEAMGLINYERRENVGLSPEGEEKARKIYSRHRILRRFFKEFLGLPEEVAEADACSAEHSLSGQTTESLVRLFEFIEVCPEAEDLFARFRNCGLVQPQIEGCDHHCPALELESIQAKQQTLLDVKPGQKGRILKVAGKGKPRSRLLDMGILPNTEFRLMGIDDPAGTRRVKIQGFELSLTSEETGEILVELA